MALTESWSQDNEDGDPNEPALFDVAMDATMIGTKKGVIVSQMLQRLTSLLELPVDLVSTLSEKMLYGDGRNNVGDASSSASLLIPGVVPFYFNNSVGGTGTTAATSTANSPWVLQASLSSVSIHWTWQERESSLISWRPLSCLLNVLAKQGDTLVINNGASERYCDSAKANTLTPSIHLQGLQISLEQQEPDNENIAVLAQAPLGNNNNNFSPIPRTRLFIKLDRLDWNKPGAIYQMNMSNITLSGVIPFLDTPSNAVAIGRTTIDQVQLTCPEASAHATTSTPPSTAGPSKNTKTANMVAMNAIRNDDREAHIFLSALLRVLNKVDTPCAALANRIPITINFTDTACNTPIHPPLDSVLPPFGTPSPKATTLGDLMRHLYLNMEDAAASAVAQRKEIKDESIKGGIRLPKIAVGDSLASSAALLATGASFVTPVGAVVSVAALGVKDGVVAAARAGKEVRGAASEEGYKFGDVARGVVSTVQKRRQERQQRHEDALHGVERSNDHEGSDQKSSSFLEQNQGRYAGVVGGSVGAAVGLTLLGPIGLVAGTLIGSHAAQKRMAKKNSNTSESSSNLNHQNLPTSVLDEPNDTEGATGGALRMNNDNDDEVIMQQLHRAGHRENQPREPQQQHQQQHQQQQQNRACAGYVVASDTAPSSSSRQESQQRPYQLGDNIRGVIARGKQVRGDSQESEYRFGDFTRGLFTSGRVSSKTKNTDT
jgi:hypothetical protein